MASREDVLDQCLDGLSIFLNKQKRSTIEISHLFSSTHRTLLTKTLSLSFWNRYDDDTLTMFHNKDSANEFVHYLNSCHSNIKFTTEFKQHMTMEFRFRTFLSPVIKITLLSHPPTERKLSQVSTRNGILSSILPSLFIWPQLFERWITLSTG